MKMKLPVAEIDTPLGKFRIAVHRGKVCAAEWHDRIVSRTARR